MNRPMSDMLKKARGTARFHMPGHKGTLGETDTTELARTDDLYAPEGGIARAERLAAISCGAAHTLMLTGGSTAGLLAMLLSTVAPGETVLLPRDAHHATMSACVWGDLSPVHFTDPLAAIAANPCARAILITRPDYYGRCADLAPIVEAARARGMLVLVDEAHGAHFPWWDIIRSAGALGADAWVQSAHKTLTALTGAAWLHLSPALDAGRARRFLRMVQTSSPPFPILQSLDDARAWMDENGPAALQSLRATLADFRASLPILGGYRDMTHDDPTRLVIGTRGHGYDGLTAQALLAEMGVDVEMADDEAVVCICTVSDTEAAFARLGDALAAIPRLAPLPAPADAAIPSPGTRVLPPRAAALGPQEAVPLDRAAGRVAAVSAGMYPPGVPLVLPGEQVTAACAAKLATLPPSRRFGVEGGGLFCVK